MFDASEAFSLTMQRGEQDQFLQAIRSRQKSTFAKFELFRTKLKSNANALPEELTEGLDLNVHAVADLLRSNRNSVGHPSGAVVSREDTFASLQLFVRYAHKLVHAFGTLPCRRGPAKHCRLTSGVKCARFARSISSARRLNASVRRWGRSRTICVKRDFILRDAWASAMSAAACVDQLRDYSGRAPVDIVWGAAADLCFRASTSLFVKSLPVECLCSAGKC